MKKYFSSFDIWIINIFIAINSIQKIIRMLAKKIFVDSFKIIGKIHEMVTQETNDNQVEEFEIESFK